MNSISVMQIYLGELAPFAAAQVKQIDTGFILTLKYGRANYAANIQ